MRRSFDRDGDELVLAAVRGLPHVNARPSDETARLFARATRHGLAGVLLDAYRAARVPLPDELERELGQREAARELDHMAHLAMLARVDRALAGAGIRGAALKGALLAERVWPRPSARPSGDIDVLVEEASLAPAMRVLETLGYTLLDHPAEARFREEGHHVHLVHDAAPELELHFHAHRGFGGTLRGEPLLARSVPHAGFEALRVLAPADELVFLAVHAASHRFMRLSWLYDVVLLLGQVSADVVDDAAARAREVAMARPLALALGLASELFAVPETDALRRATHVLGRRRRFLSALVEEPTSATARAATRFAYTIALCDDPAAALRYARRAVVDRLTRTPEAS